MRRWKTISVILVTGFFVGCGTYFNQPIKQQSARTGELTTASKTLKDLPKPQKKVVVGVYSFKDQTGQYKEIQNGSSFSTAVTQGGTSILIKALEDSEWFTPIERENLSNLLNERNIIRSTRQEYAGSNGPAVPPLLFAGVLLEGGVVSYDTNILTGGFGARYFGAGGSTQYKQDRITVYLRAISTSNGEILKTVYVSKTILSQAIDASLFRYVNFQRLLEVETGYTKNEPLQLVVKEAIEKAVEAIIIEGLEEKIWSAENPEEAQTLIEKYNQEKQEEQAVELYNRKKIDFNYTNAFEIQLGLNRFLGDYGARDFDYIGKLGYHRRFIPHFGASLRGYALDFEIPNSKNTLHLGVDLDAEVYLLPYDKFSPFFHAGAGMLFQSEKNNWFTNQEEFFKLQYGAGLQYNLNSKLNVFLKGTYHLAFSDEIDALNYGKRDDYFIDLGIGLTYMFGGNKEKNTNKDEE